MKTTQSQLHATNRHRASPPPTSHHILAGALMAGLLLCASLPVHAAPVAQHCRTGDAAPCTLAFGALRANFMQGQYGFDGDSQQSGQDSWVTGYTVGTYDFPNLFPLETPGSHGFWFAPGMAGSVGGSGFSGDHQAEASFEFADLVFVAAPGWKIDSLRMTITGERQSFGDATTNLSLPGLTVEFNGDDFIASGLLPHYIPHYRAGFNLSTSYEEGEDGTAAVYGTARAQIDRVSIQAQMTRLTIPEPASPILLAAALLAWGVSARARPRKGQHAPPCKCALAMPARVATNWGKSSPVRALLKYQP